jgi:hypothetical protein
MTAAAGGSIAQFMPLTAAERLLLDPFAFDNRKPCAARNPQNVRDIVLIMLGMNAFRESES